MASSSRDHGTPSVCHAPQTPRTERRSIDPHSFVRIPGGFRRWSWGVGSFAAVDSTARLKVVSPALEPFRPRKRAGMIFSAGLAVRKTSSKAAADFEILTLFSMHAANALAPAQARRILSP
jgi:hypothetical protein